MHRFKFKYSHSSSEWILPLCPLSLKMHIVIKVNYKEVKQAYYRSTDTYTNLTHSHTIKYLVSTHASW